MDAAYPHVAERLFGRAHPIEPRALRAIIESPAARRIISGDPAARPEAGKKDLRKARRQRLSALVDGEWAKVADGMGDYFVTSTGIAIVPVVGLLAQRFDWLAAICGWTTYEGLAASFDAMLEDNRVKAVLMDVESPGGECAGMLDVADKIIAARADKPVWAVANAYAFSAAYAIAGSATRLIVPRLAEVGSIGAVAIHLDQSGYDQALGLKYTAVFSGARKIDGWQHAPLSDEAHASIQQAVDYCRDQFAELVARQGRMIAAAALATEANLYFDQAAVDAKLADGVGTFEQALSDLADVAASRSRTGLTSAATAGQHGDGAMANKPATDTKIEAPATAEAPANQPAAGTDKPAIVASSPAAGESKPALAAAEQPKAGLETCPECGKQYDPDSKSAAAAGHYGLPAVLAVVELCATQDGVSAKRVHELVKAKTPLADARAAIAADKARAADAHQIDSTVRSQPQGGNWDKAVDKFNKRVGSAAA